MERARIEPATSGLGRSYREFLSIERRERASFGVSPHHL
jgi:hypothetical protein